jgi:predicted metal-dependent hydrolase
VSSEPQSVDARFLTIAGIKVEVVRKDIKNLHLGVYPPNGRVRVAAPLVVSDAAVRLAVIDKLGWIKRQRAKFAAQPRQSPREMVNGESHYFMGKRYRLRVLEQAGPAMVAIRGIASLDLFVRPGTSPEQREVVLLHWHRDHLRSLIPPLLEKWQPVLGVQVADWGIKKMKTKWGSCNIAARRIWLNLELAKKPSQCLEYIVVHELLHLLERHHNERFLALLDAYMPRWRQYQEMLNKAPLGHEEWGLAVGPPPSGACPELANKKADYAKSA